MTKLVEELIRAAKDLSDRLSQLSFSAPVHFVYNPLVYAWRPHEAYLKTYAKPTCEVVFLGMNPGPFGMAQTGVPFGEINAVRDWLGIHEPVDRPGREHPKRPIEGFGCNKSEVSGRRLWGLFAERYKTPADFFKKHFVANYCPLVFMDEGGRNVTPDKIAKKDRKALDQQCDEHLKRLIECLQPKFSVGVGGYAEDCLKRVAAGSHQYTVSRILHPSPASPAANRGWDEQVKKQLIEAGIWESA
jgi:single-strand selective monofunctional uracil DNA glycosylase